MTNLLVTFFLLLVLSCMAHAGPSHKIDFADLIENNISEQIDIAAHIVERPIEEKRQPTQYQPIELPVISITNDELFESSGLQGTRVDTLQEVDREIVGL